MPMRQQGGQALSRSADLTDAAAVDALFAASRDRFGQVDILVANAGGLLKRSRCVDTDPHFWDQAIALNLTSAFLCCRAALTEMEPRGSGAIVLMSSLAAFDGGGPGTSTTPRPRAPSCLIREPWRRKSARFGIRVNGVAPGLIGTRFHDVFNTPEGRRTTVERTPLRREGTPDDVAETILFLASPRASFLTGETIQINGGLGMFQVTLRCDRIDPKRMNVIDVLVSRRCPHGQSLVRVGCWVWPGRPRCRSERAPSQLATLS